uniref:RRM domain-containing protein n=1 Tax=Percolomonas cosmopolitus TaxID=63605 RepID=A0A7S1KMT1_9EUKA|eukprot:CAMPEP_0117444082 /NCGR_PEP_ID=MMETSP0759-20121206/5045_1 /TAXON_ID=63605 /ORGANISM="Percolomonas cosmopolitus, Strain WS" /LENGTH=851 /DNA_ID=CAMNT_0005236113 /DNA_START=39 /DNA_END=2594 /DNA_ORIENTATION=+
MSFLGKNSSNPSFSRSSSEYTGRKRSLKPRNNKFQSQQSNSAPKQTHVPTTESLRTLFLTHLPPSFTNTNSVYTAQERINNLIAQHIGPNNVQKVKVIGEGRAKIVFKMAIWAKQVKKAMQGLKVQNDSDWVAQQKRAQEKDKKEQEEFSLQNEFKHNDHDDTDNFNHKVKDIVPLTKDHFGNVSKLGNRKISTIRQSQKPSKKEENMSEKEYQIKVVDHEEKLETAQVRHRNRDVVVKGIPKSLTLKEAETKLNTWLSSIGVITNIRIPAKGGSIQEHTGYAFVTFMRPKHAEMAIEMKNGRKFEGRKLIIEEKLSRDSYLKQKEEEEEKTAQVPRVSSLLQKAPEMDNEEKQRKLDKAARIRTLQTKISTLKDPKELEETKKKQKGDAKKKEADMEDESSDDDSSSSSSSESDEQSIQGFSTDSDEEEMDKTSRKEKNTKKNENMLKGIPAADIIVAQEKDGLTEDERAEINRTVFVRNIPVGASEEDVILLFSHYGIVEDCKLVLNRKTGAPTGTGFVLYQNSKSFKKLFSSVKLANTMTMMEKKADDRLSLHEFKQTIKKLPEKTQKRRLKEYLRETSMAKRKEKEEAPTQNFWSSDELQIDSCPLYIAKAVPKKQAREKMLSQELDKAKDKRNLHLAIEGFIPRDSPAALGVPEKLLRKMEEKHIEKQNNLRTNPSLHVSNKRLKVSYIPKTWDRRRVHNVFSDAVKRQINKFPKIHQVIILFDDKGKSKGMGFVEFEKHENALIALREINNNPTVYSGGRMYIEFAIDDMKKLHNMRFKKNQMEKEGGGMTQNRIQKIFSKVENEEVKERIERVMNSSRPQAFKRKREREEMRQNGSKFKRQRRE